MTGASLHLPEFFRLAALALPVWLLLRLCFGKKPRQPRREAVSLLLLLCLLFIAAQTLTEHGGGFSAPVSPEQALERWHRREAINLKPCFTIRNFLRHGTPEMQRTNLLGNVLLFLPLGVLLPLKAKLFHWAPVTALTCAGLSALIELAQLFLRRSVDVDDLILNALGGLLGWLIWLIVHLIARLFRKKT